MIKEFKEFAMKGSLLDMAVGIILGLAFGKIITSFVNDVLMPPIGLALGKVDFSNLFINLSPQPVASLEQARSAGVPVIAYGMFLNSIIDFLIVAFILFLIIRQANKMRAPVAAPRECQYCCTPVSDKATKCPACASPLEG